MIKRSRSTRGVCPAILHLLRLFHHDISDANRRLNANPLLREKVHEQLARNAVTSGLEDGLAGLVFCDVVEVHVEEVGGIEGATFGLWVELR